MMSTQRIVVCIACFVWVVAHTGDTIILTLHAAMARAYTNRPPSTSDNDAGVESDVGWRVCTVLEKQLATANAYLLNRNGAGDADATEIKDMIEELESRLRRCDIVQNDFQQTPALYFIQRMYGENDNVNSRSSSLSEQISAALPLHKLERVAIDSVVHALGDSPSNSVSGCSASVNHEFSTTAIVDMLGALQPPLDSSDMFYDMGSGRGMVSMVAFVVFNLTKTVGVEMATTRMIPACDATSIMQAHSEFKHSSAAGARYLDFYEENMLETDVEDATVVFLDATCFQVPLMTAVLLKFLGVSKRTRRTIRVISINRGFHQERQQGSSSCRKGGFCKMLQGDSLVPPHLAAYVKQTGTLPVGTAESQDIAFLTNVIPPPLGLEIGSNQGRSIADSKPRPPKCSLKWV